MPEFLWDQTLMLGVLLTFGSGSLPGHAAGIAPVKLRCEYLVDPIGLDVVQPRLSWQLQAGKLQAGKLRASDPAHSQPPGETSASERPASAPTSNLSRTPGLAQSACQILVASSREKLQRDQGDLWDSGKLPTPTPIHHAYGGRPLSAGQSCWWKVRVWDGQGAHSPWSQAAHFSIGPLKQADWTAAWIGPDPATATAHVTDPKQAAEADWGSADHAFEKRFPLAGQWQSAYAYVASLGYHELYLNGQKVGDRLLAPHISDLSQHARYVTYDLGPLLREGENHLTILANSGWAGFPRFGSRRLPAVRCQLDIRQADGRQVRITTDRSWLTVRTGARRLQRWVQPHYGSDWQEYKPEPVATRLWEPPIRITAEQAEPNRCLETLTPIAIEQRPGGWRLDFGRTFTGCLNVPLTAPAGSVIKLAISERADQQVSYGQTYELVIPASGQGRFQHRFNYTCGRWLTIIGPVEKPQQVRACLVHADFPRLARFHCSNPLLNRIHDTTIWTFRCLSLGGYVVDCPHRERLGYGGDAHATIPTGLAHFGLGAFYTKWLDDWRDVQAQNGDIPHTAPTYEGGGGPAWSGVVIQLPWRMYVSYGDTRVLEENWPLMTRWLHFLDTKVTDGLLRPYGSPEWGFLGDWVPPGRKQPKGTRVDDHSTLFFNNCYWFWSLETAAKIAHVLGKGDEANRLRTQAAEVRKRVHEAFWNPERGIYANGEQPYLAFPLLIGLTPKQLRSALAEKLEQTILVTDQGHINAGIHGHVLLLDYLTRAGRSDLVFDMVSKTDYPSWGHMLEEGATTIWEQWDGQESRCHSSFLGVGAWFIRGLAGICPDPSQPGYEHFFVRPQVCGDVTRCEASYDSIRGPIESRWNIEAGTLKLTTRVPPGTTATVVLPGDKPEAGQTVGPGIHHFMTKLP